MEMRYLFKIYESLMKFMKTLAKELFDNSYINDKLCTSPKTILKRKISHILETAPTCATIYDGGRWVCTAKCICHKYICHSPNHKKQIRTRFLCSLGTCL